MTSTVPELVGVELPEDMKSNRSSWLHRRSRTPSPRKDDQQGNIGGRVELDVKGTIKGHRVSSGEIFVSSKKPQPYKPVLVDRDNAVNNNCVCLFV